MELCYELRNDDLAPASARRAVERDLGELIDQSVLGALCVVVSELVTRGVVDDPSAAIILRLELDRHGCVTGEIASSGLEGEPDRLSTGSPLDGRRAILDALTDRWGLAEDERKVWFEISA